MARAIISLDGSKREESSEAERQPSDRRPSSRKGLLAGRASSELERLLAFSAAKRLLIFVPRPALSVSPSVCYLAENQRAQLGRSRMHSHCSRRHPVKQLLPLCACQWTRRFVQRDSSSACYRGRKICPALAATATKKRSSSNASNRPLSLGVLFACCCSLACVIVAGSQQAA